MSFARTALRLLVVQAISGSAGSRPTIAEGRVYDSRLSPEQPEVFGEDARPTVIVFTDADTGDALSDQNGGPPFKRNIDLVFDLGMVLREKAEGDADGYLIGWPDTDARLEASLDVLQAQILRHLDQSSDPLAVLFQRFIRVWSQSSFRQVEDETGMKLARRIWTLTCQVPDDDFSDVADGATGLDRLPDPLRTIAQLMPTGSSGADTCAAIAAAFPPLETPVAFEGLDLTIDAGSPADKGATDHHVVAKAETEQP